MLGDAVGGLAIDGERRCVLGFFQSFHRPALDVNVAIQCYLHY